MNKLKKHILGEFVRDSESEKSKRSVHMEGMCSYVKNDGMGPTVLTETIETSDPDCFFADVNGPTILTHAVESSDPDEFIAGGSTVETRVIENSDPDEFSVEEPLFTYSVEDGKESDFFFM